MADFAWPEAVDEHSGVSGYFVDWGTDPHGTSDVFVQGTSYQLTGAVCVDVCVAYLRLRALDRVSNTADDRTTVFTLYYDGSPPAVDFTFFDGITETSQVQVMLNISATDLGSGLQAMRISNDSHNWEPWELYASQRLWAIEPASGHWMPVFIQVKDCVSLLSSVASHQVYLNANPALPSSAHYRLWDFAITQSSGALSSPNYLNHSTVGQTIDSSEASSTHYALTGGFEATNHIPAAPPSPETPPDSFTAVCRSGQP